MKVEYFYERANFLASFLSPPDAASGSGSGCPVMQGNWISESNSVSEIWNGQFQCIASTFLIDDNSMYHEISVKIEWNSLFDLVFVSLAVGSVSLRHGARLPAKGWVLERLSDVAACKVTNQHRHDLLMCRHQLLKKKLGPRRSKSASPYFLLVFFYNLLTILVSSVASFMSCPYEFFFPNTINMFS